MLYLANRYLREAGWSDWSVLQLRAGESPLWLFFQPGQDTPAAVGKFSAVPLNRERLRRECAALELLRPTARELSVPLVLYQNDSDRGFLSLQSGMPGKPLADELSPSDAPRLEHHFRIVETWLERFQSLVSPAGYADAALRLLLPLVSGMAPPALVEAAAGVLPLLSAIPAVAVHGDLWGRNVLAAPGRTSVVDWEAFHYGAPLEDLFGFALGSVFRRWPDIDRSADLIWDVFFGRSQLAIRARAACARSLARLAMPQDLLRPVFLMYLVDRLTRVHFADNAAMRVFAGRYVAAGMPCPWEIEN
jgi:hypothetical protein